jgi:hypothetical protein
LHEAGPIIIFILQAKAKVMADHVAARAALKRSKSLLQMEELKLHEAGPIIIFILQAKAKVMADHVAARAALKRSKSLLQMEELKCMKRVL